MQRGLRLLGVGAALIVLLDVLVLVGQSDDEPSTSVAGVQFEPTTSAPSTTVASGTTLVAAPAEITTTTSVPIVQEGGATTASSTPTTVRSAQTATTAASSPRQVVERSDNTSTFVYDQGGSSPISVVPADPSDPFRFVVAGNDANQDGTAELRAELANQTDRDIGFPGGLLLRFHLAKNGRFWKTVEFRFADVTMLAARGSLQVESPAPLDGPGRYDVAGETLVEYR